MEQLLQLQNYVGSKAVSIVLLTILLLWTLSNSSNELALIVWGAAVILSNLNAYRHARRCIVSGIPFEQAHRKVWELMALRAVDGILWGVLPWITLDTSTTAGSIMVVSTIGAMAGGATSLLSPVLPVYVAFVIPEMAGIALKLWSLGDPAYKSLGVGVVIFFAAMFGQARNSARAAREAIEVRFKLAASQKQLHEIEQRQMLSQERQRLMQDMHDGLGSSLTSALRVIEHGSMDEAEVAQMLKGCIDDLKLAIDSMEPVDADLLLLLATLRYRLGPRLENTGIALRWEVENVTKLDWLDPKNALHILRILQEAFTNIIKHTRATEIRVATRMDNDHAVVTVTDNGQGFAVENALKNGGKGLSNQMRRAEAIGAEVKFDSSDAGTCFTLRLPIKHITETTG